MAEDKSIKIGSNFNSIVLYIKFETRKNIKVFNNERIKEVLDTDLLKTYMHKQHIEVLSAFTSIGDELYLRVRLQPDVAISNFVYNFKRFAFGTLKKDPKVKNLMKGEHALFTRQFAVSDDIHKLDELLEKVIEHG